MFCSNCGQEVQSGVKFCSNCGNAILEEKEIKVESSAGVFNRDVVIQYLYDLRNLEIAKVKLHKRMKETTEKCKGLGIPQLLKKRDNSFSILGSIGIIILIIAIFMGVVGISTSTIEIIFTSFVSFVSAISCFVIYFKQKKETEIDYNNSVRNDRQRVEKEKKEKEQLENDYKNIENELTEAESLLQKSYSVNLIPLQYRNIQAIFYLYNYLSTSQENIQSALLQCNLEEVKIKMGTMIEQQSEMILEMAIQNAQLEEMKSQSRRLLNHAAQTERNTALAAQYAKIAANNAEATAWIGIANYIKTK